jgi:hypothetical protein
MNAHHKHEGLEMEFAQSVRAAVLAAIAIVVLLVSAGTQDGAGIVSDATAAAAPVDAQGYEYFPAGFPPPEGPIEPHIEAF